MYLAPPRYLEVLRDVCGRVVIPCEECRSRAVPKVPRKVWHRLVWGVTPVTWAWMLS